MSLSISVSPPPGQAPISQSQDPSRPVSPLSPADNNLASFSLGINPNTSSNAQQRRASALSLSPANRVRTKSVVSTASFHPPSGRIGGGGGEMGDEVITNSPLYKSLQRQLERDKVTFEQDLLAKDRTVRRLMRQFTQCESERDTVQLTLSDTIKKHEKETEKLETEINTLTDKIRGMAQKLERLPGIERFIIDTFLEFKDPALDPPDLHADELIKRQTLERDQLKKQSPLATLDTLRHSLRTQFARKADEIAELHRSITKTAVETESIVTSAEDKVREADLEKEKALQIKTQAEQSIKQWMDEKDQLNKRHAEEVARLKEEIASLKKTVSEKDKTNAALEANVERRDELLLTKEIRLVRVSQMEKQMSIEKHRHNLETQNMKVHSLQQRQELEKESMELAKARIEIRTLQQTIKQLTQQLHDTKISLSRSGVVEAEKKAQTMEDRLKDVQSANNEVKKERDRLLLENEELKRRIAEMKSEYEKIYAATQHMQEVQATNVNRFIYNHGRSRYQGDNSGMQVSALKAKLEEKEAECQQLMKRLKKLIFASHRDQKYYELEVNSLVEDMEEIHRAVQDKHLPLQLPRTRPVTSRPRQSIFVTEPASPKSTTSRASTATSRSPKSAKAGLTGSTKLPLPSPLPLTPSVIQESGVTVTPTNGIVMKADVV